LENFDNIIAYYTGEIRKWTEIEVNSFVT